MIASSFLRSPLAARIKIWLLTLGPSRTTFVCSILLSLIAIQKGTLNRDGMFYVETARIYLSDGLAAALSNFNWPFLPLLMAITSQLTGLHLEVSGHVLNAFFMAGACALLVSSSRQIFPEATWYIGLIALSIPGLNGYRDELLREYGCWFFIMLSIWLALRWSARPTWTLALITQCVLSVAALFRPEALALFPALLLWQWFDAPYPERWHRFAMISSLPTLGLIVLMGLIAVDQLNAGRIVDDLQRLMLRKFASTSVAFAGILPEYGRDQATLILFFGSIAIIPIKFIVKMGVFLLPLIYSFSGQVSPDILKRNSIFNWMFLAHLLVLSVFVLEMQFLAGRYIAPLLLFSAPLAGYGIYCLIRRFPTWKLPLVLLALSVAASNVISLAEPKNHYIEAGAWVAANAKDTPQVYIDSARTAYYAGWKYSKRPSPNKRSRLLQGLERNEYDLVVLEVTHRNSDIVSSLKQRGFEVVVEFRHHNGDRVVVAKRIAVTP